MFVVRIDDSFRSLSRIQVDLTRSRFHIHVRIVAIPRRLSTIVVVVISTTPIIIMIIIPLLTGTASITSSITIATTWSIARPIPGHQRELQFERPRLFGRHLAQTGRMRLCLMHLEVDFGAEDARKLLIQTRTLVTHKVFAVEVVAQRGVVLVELVRAVRVAKVAEVVLATEVTEQFVAVHVAHVAVLAERVAPVRLVVHVPFAVVQGQVGAIVATALEREDLEVVRAQVAVVELVLTADMSLQQVEGDKVARWVALEARVVQEFVEGVLHGQSGETDAVPLVVKAGPDVGVQRAVRLLNFRVNHLGELRE